jgi:hypothetical protein
MRKPTRVLVVLVAALGLTWADSVPAQAAVAVSIQSEATLLASGAVGAVVVASCDRGDRVLEAQLSVSQDNRALSGQAGIPIRCDGKSRKYRVMVGPFEGAFHAGGAFASAFVLTCAVPTCGMTDQGHDTRTITVR